VCRGSIAIAALLFVLAPFYNSTVLVLISLVVGLGCLLGLIWSDPSTPNSTPVNVVLTFWLALLGLAALPGLMLTGMAFEGGHTLDAYLSLVAVWSYPLLVAIACFYRRRRPLCVGLPLITPLLFVVPQLVLGLWHPS
jgi:hypothetical protein